MDKGTGHLAWIDLEMTGLDTDHDFIIEIAAVVSDKNLQLVEEGPSLVIHQADEVLAGMDEWNQHHHKQSGLIKEVRKSRIGCGEAEKTVLSFFRRHIEDQASCLLYTSPSPRDRQKSRMPSSA